MIRVDEIRTALISALKANTTIMAQLSDADEVRQHDWKGTEFSYPNIRVRIIDANPDPNPDCSQEITGSIYIYSEEASSLQADTIAGIIADEYHGKSLNSNSIFFTRIICDLVGAIQQGQLTWRSEVLVRSMIQRT